MTEYRHTKNPYLMPGAVLIAGVLVAAAIIFTQRPTNGDAIVERSEDESAPKEISIDTEGWPSLGDPNAPVVMVEYSDYACGYCGSFHNNTFSAIKEQYIDTGKVRFIYKDFTVVGGEMAAEAAHCAAEQDAYWEYHDLLFSNQQTDRPLWSNAETHRGYAEELGLDAEALVDCFTEERYASKVRGSMNEALLNGAGGTPHFFVNGRAVSGAQPFPAFKTVIDAEINKAS